MSKLLKSTPNLNLPAVEIHPRIKEVQNAVQGAGLPALTTADAIPTREALAEASKALMEWKARIIDLDTQNADEWTEHGRKIQQLVGIDRDDQVKLFTKLKAWASIYKIGYNRDARRFFVSNVSSLI